MLFFLPACTRVEPMDRTVDSSTYTSFTMWMNHAAEDLAPEQLADLRRALQQMRYAIMADGSASGSDAVETELMERVNGHTVRDVIGMGLMAELRRATAERDEVTKFLDRDNHAWVPDYDYKKRMELEHIIEVHEARLKAATDEVSDLRARMAADGLSGFLPADAR